MINVITTSFDMWECAVRCVATLDVLASLTTYRFYMLPSSSFPIDPHFSLSACSESEMCRPCVAPPTSGRPYLRIVSGRHPCISQTYSGEEFIPNDVVIEGERQCTVVTGPNMGGKSTLMRQTGLIVILAQLVSC